MQRVLCFVYPDQTKGQHRAVCDKTPTKEQTMKKQYGVSPITQSEYVASANENRSSGSARVERPLFKITGTNAKLLTGGEFKLPLASETTESSLEVAYRILGYAYTEKLLPHLPQKVTSDMVGLLGAFYPMAIHKRFGLHYTDFICPESTRTEKCSVCSGRMDLFQSPLYKSGVLTKENIMERGFGTRMMAVFFAQVYFDGEDRGLCLVCVPLTNEAAKNARKENFFDLVETLTTPKKLSGENLPLDYYSNGDGSRWLVAEYTKAFYGEEAKTKPGDKKNKFGPRPYWKLSKITPLREIEGVGKAEDIWWPEINGEDGATLIDVYALLDHAPKEMLKQESEECVALVVKKAKGGGHDDDENKTGKMVWADIVAIRDVDGLIKVGTEFGADVDEMTEIGSESIAMLRRYVAKCAGIVPPKFNAAHAPVAAHEESENNKAETSADDDDALPF